MVFSGYPIVRHHKHDKGRAIIYPGGVGRVRKKEKFHLLIWGKGATLAEKYQHQLRSTQSFKIRGEVQYTLKTREKSGGVCHHQDYLLLLSPRRLVSFKPHFHP